MTGREGRAAARSGAPLAWLAAAAFTAAAAWPAVSEGEFPLVGLRPLAEPGRGWPLVGGTVALALALATPAGRSRRGLLACAGAALLLLVGSVVFVAPAAGLVFAFLTGDLLREGLRRPRTP